MRTGTVALFLAPDPCQGQSAHSLVRGLEAARLCVPAPTVLDTPPVSAAHRRPARRPARQARLFHRRPKGAWVGA